MSIFFVSRQILEPQKSWEDWVRLKSLSKVRREYEEQGIINPRTGNAPNESAIQKSAYVYVLRNPEVAREQFEFECRENGNIPSEELWKEKLYKIAWLLYYQRPNRMKNYIVQHGLESYDRRS